MTAPGLDPMIRALTVSGLIPFLGLPLLGWTGMVTAAEAQAAQGLYGLGIGSFMAGTHWGLALPRQDWRLMALSVVPMLLLWAAALLLPWSWVLLLTALVLLAELRLDRELRPHLPAQYWPLRVLVAGVAAAGLGLGALLA